MLDGTVRGISTLVIPAWEGPFCGVWRGILSYREAFGDGYEHTGQQAPFPSKNWGHIEMTCLV